MKPNVLVTSYYDPSATAAALGRLAGVANVRRVGPAAVRTPQSLLAELRNAQIAIVSDEPFSESVLCAANDLRMICCDGVGFDHIDIEAATRNEIVVTNAPMVHESNGDFVMGMMLSLVRKIGIADAGVRHGQWHERARYLSRDVFGSTLGLIGFGRVARAVARRAKAFDMRVVAYSPHADRQAARSLGVEVATFAEVLQSSDIVSIHVTLNDQTRDLIGALELSQMKRGAYLINSSRGAVVNESALVQSLQTGQLAGAAMDVFHLEPPPLDHPLLKLENVLLSPHIGSDTVGTFARVFDCVVDDILLFLRGERPRHVVNPAVLQRTSGLRQG